MLQVSYLLDWLVRIWKKKKKGKNDRYTSIDTFKSYIIINNIYRSIITLLLLQLLFTHIWSYLELNWKYSEQSRVFLSGQTVMSGICRSILTSHLWLYLHSLIYWPCMDGWRSHGGIDWRTSYGSIELTKKTLHYIYHNLTPKYLINNTDRQTKDRT